MRSYEEEEVCILPMEYQWIDCYSTGTNRTIGTNGRVECTLSQILSYHNAMHFTNEIPISGKPLQWNTNGTNGTNGMECYSIGDNGSIGTNGQCNVECTPTQPEAIEKINNEIHLTNGIPIDCMSFHWNPFVCIGQPSGLSTE